MADEGSPPGEVRTVRQIGVWSVTKIAVLSGFLLGLLTIPLVLVGEFVGVSVSVGQTLAVVLGLGFYGGFAAAVVAVVYNLAAEFVGGVAVRVE